MLSRLPGFIFVVFLCASPGAAAATTQAIRTMNHRSWTVAHGGAPADIWDMKQDTRGFIWLATGGGLYRFDGLRFERYAPSRGAFRSNDMTALYVAGDDDIWIGTNEGFVSHAEKGRVTNYPSGGRAPQGPVYCFAMTPDGTLWAVSGDGLLRFRDGVPQPVGRDMGLAGTGEPMWLLLGRDGTLWLATDGELLYLRRGGHRFERTGVATGLYAVLAQAPDGTLWVSDAPRGTRALPGLSAGHVPAALRTPPPQTSFGEAKRILFDMDGALWGTPVVANGVDGVFRLSNPRTFATGKSLEPAQLTDVFMKEDGLTSIVAGTMLVDREGDVWVGTNFGLNSFRAASFHVMSPGKGENPASAWLSADSGGDVFVLQGNCLYRMAGTTPSGMGCGFPGREYSLFRAGERFYTETAAGLYRWSADEPATMIPHPRQVSQAQVRATAVDGRGDVWASTTDGIFRLDGTQWHRVPLDDGLGGIHPVAMAFHDGLGWFGYGDGRVMRYDGSSYRAYGVAEGLDVGSIQAVSDLGGNVLVGGDMGVAVFHEGRFRSLPMDRLNLEASVTGMALTRLGDLWLNTTRGVVQVGAVQWRAFLADPAHAPSYRLYGADEGVPGIALVHPLNSTISADRDGRLWFGTNQGVAWVDPSALRANVIAPDVVVESIEADGKRFIPGDGVELPPGTTVITMQYTAPTFLSPHRASFRYRLDGVDQQWQDAGAMRQATYANLHPGNYTFRVMAANSDGVWSDQPGTFAFSIAPTFYQTVRFRAAVALLLALAIIAMVAIAYRRSLARVHERLEVRHAERERIARDLHDTLLQGVQGILLRFQAVAERLSRNDPLRPHFDAALGRAEDIVVEARERVQEMRANGDADKNLGASLAHLGDTLSAEWSIAFAMVCMGDARSLARGVGEELFLVGREALANAFRHAQASMVELELEFAPDRFCLRILDNGVGIPADVLEAGHKPGHFGLVGMAERVDGLGGSMKITARACVGTRLEISVPARVAYAEASGRRPPWWRPRR